MERVPRRQRRQGPSSLPVFVRPPLWVLGTSARCRATSGLNVGTAKRTWTAWWWLEHVFIFTYIGDNHPNWLIIDIFQRSWNHQPVKAPFQVRPIFYGGIETMKFHGCGLLCCTVKMKAFKVSLWACVARLLSYSNMIQCGSFATLSAFHPTWARWCSADRVMGFPVRFFLIEYGSLRFFFSFWKNIKENRMTFEDQDKEISISSSHQYFGNVDRMKIKKILLSRVCLALPRCIANSYVLQQSQRRVGKLRCGPGRSPNLSRCPRHR